MFPRISPMTALLVSLLATATLHAQQPAAAPLPREFVPAPGKLAFKDGETLVFLGDSITHQCLYTQYIEDFFYTRFPGTRIHFHNAGTAGDRAGDALTRFQEDVAVFKPQYVAVLLGMNDGNFTEMQPAIFETFQKDMTALLDTISQAGATPVLLTPSLYDPVPNRLQGRGQEPRDSQYPGVLEKYGGWLKEQAKQRKLNVADFNRPLNEATTEQRRSEADWSIIPDGMHPTPTGHVLMAAAFLSEVAFHPPVADVQILRKDGKMVGAGANGLLSEIAEEGDKLSFDFTAKSLPWVLPPEAEEGRKLLKPTLKLNSERLIVRGLKPGKFELKIDGEPVGQWTDAELSTGAELGENAKTPQYQQALKVATLNKQRNAMGEHPMRMWWAQLKVQQGALKKAQEKENASQLPQKQKQFDTWLEGMKKSVDEYVAKSRELEDEIYTTNQPVAHRYELAPVPQN